MPRKRILVILAMVWIGFLLFYIRTYKPTPAAPMETVDVLIAKTDIAVNHPLLATQVDWKTIPMKQLEAGDIQKTPEALQDYVGHKLLIPISAQQIIKTNYFVQAEGGILAQSIRPGKYAVTIVLNELNNKNRLVNPGDTVDVLLTRMFASEDSLFGKSGFVTQIVVANVRILAVNNKMADELLDNSQPLNGQRTLTLEVSAHQAELLSFAQASGSLSFSIHSSDGAFTAPTLQPVSNKSVFLFPQAIEEYHGDKVLFKSSS